MTTLEEPPEDRSTHDESPDPRDSEERLLEVENRELPDDAAGRLVDEQGEESFPASDPPAY